MPQVPHQAHIRITLPHLLVLILTSTFFAGSAFSEIYKSVDSQGRVHYTDKKEAGNNQELVVLKTKESHWKQFDIQIIDADKILTKKETDSIKRDVKLVYRFYDEKLFFDIHKTVPVKIRLFKSETDYINYLNKHYNGQRIRTRGMYMLSTNEILVWLNPVRWRTFWTIKHEVSHAIVDTLTPYVPAWLNEGLAENMEAIGISKNNELFLYRHAENFNWVSRNRGSDQVKDISAMLSLTSNQWRDASQYESTGEFVRMLLSSKTGQSFVVRLIHIFKRGDRTLSHIHADKHYLGGMRVLMDDWNRWINRSSSKWFYL